MSNKVERAKMLKTRDFESLDQLTSFMVTHLYELYDHLEGVEEYSDDWEFIQGSIETTQVYLHKAGVEYLEHTDYIEKLENAKWQKA